MRQLRKAFTCAIVCALLLFSLAVPAHADPTCPSSQLTIRVGYFGGPYYEKAVYSAAALERMGTHSCLYTCMDSGGFLRYAEAEGVYLSDIMYDAGIDINSINRCHFSTCDSGTDYFKSLGCNTLFWSDRYAFPDLAQYWSQGTGQLTQEQLDAVWDTAQPVQAMLSLRDNFKRVSAETPYHTGDNGSKTDEDSFRLLFGQTQPLGINDVAGDSANGASNMAKWVYAIDVELGGAPSLSVNEEQLELKVGSDYRVTVTVNAADSTIRQEIENNLQWESSDSSIVSVDGSGKLTAHRQGEVTITAYDPHYDGLSATLQIVVGEAENLSGGENREQGDDAGRAGANGGGGKSSSVGSKTAGDGTQLTPDVDSGDIDPLPLYVTKATQVPAAKLTEEVHSIRVNRVTIDSDTGGVQNWREQAMAEDSTALGLITQDNPLTAAASVTAAGLLLCGGVVMYVRFKEETKEVNADD